jgi:hypothetical protein
MSQGLRGGRMGKLFAGLGALLCASVVGCTDVDKPKFGTNTKQPGPGLPGTARLSGQPGSGGLTNSPYGMNNSLQPTSGMGSTGRSAGGVYGAGNTNFGTGANTNSIVPSVGPPNNYQPIGNGHLAGEGLGTGSSTGAGARYQTPPSLSDVGQPPPYPGSNGAPVLPPPGGQGPLMPNR